MFKTLYILMFMMGAIMAKPKASTISSSTTIGQTSEGGPECGQYEGKDRECVPYYLCNYSEEKTKIPEGFCVLNLDVCCLVSHKISYQQDIIPSSTAPTTSIDSLIDKIFGTEPQKTENQDKIPSSIAPTTSIDSLIDKIFGTVPQKIQNQYQISSSTAPTTSIDSLIDIIFGSEPQKTQDSTEASNVVPMKTQTENLDSVLHHIFRTTTNQYKDTTKGSSTPATETETENLYSELDLIFDPDT